MVGFADDPLVTTKFVMLTRGLSSLPDIPEEITGGLYFEYSDETMPGYACVRAITLGADRITIKVDRDACPQVPHAELLITFDPADPHSADLATLISDIVGEDATFKRSGRRA